MPQSELPLSKLGLDRCKVPKLTLDLDTHSIQHVTKISKQVISRKIRQTGHMILSELS